jgi:hypothetical protein
MADSIAPTAQMYLEQTGLMAPQVLTAVDIPYVGWY